MYIITVIKKFESKIEYSSKLADNYEKAIEYVCRKYGKYRGVTKVTQKGGRKIFKFSSCFIEIDIRQAKFIQ